MYNTIAQSKDVAEALSYWATAGGILVTIVAGSAAYWKYRRDQRAHRWDQAVESMGRFMDLGIEHPEFYPGCWSTGVQSDPVRKNKYTYFMARFLWAAEDILMNMPPDDHMWHQALKKTMYEHADYFRSPEAAEELAGYCQPLQQLVAEALKDPAARQAETTPKPPRTRRAR